MLVANWLLISGVHWLTWLLQAWHNMESGGRGVLGNFKQVVTDCRSSHDPNKVIFTFTSYLLTEDEKSLLCKGHRFCIPSKTIEYADFLTQFELLFREYRNTIMFEMKSEIRNFLKQIKRYLFVHIVSTKLKTIYQKWSL